MTAKTETDRSMSFTSYKITGSLEAVFKAIAEIFKQYHPLGYSTKVQGIVGEVDGTFTARVWRANSCD